MPNPNGTAVVMKFNDVLDLEEHLYFLSMELHTNLFEIVPVQLITCETDSETKCCTLCNARHSRKHITLHMDSEYQKRKLSEETDSDRGIRLQRAKEFKKESSQRKLTVRDKLDLRKKGSPKKKEIRGN
jgi:hypothetical protein